MKRFDLGITGQTLKRNLLLVIVLSAGLIIGIVMAWGWALAPLILLNALLLIFFLWRAAKGNQHLADFQRNLNESQEMLNKAQEIAHVGSWSWDMSTDRLTWSEESFRIFGYPPGEIEPSYDIFQQRLHPNDRETLANAVNESVIFDHPFNISHRIIQPDGTKRIVQELGEVIRDPTSGEAIRMVGVIRDITELKVNEYELQLSNSVFRHSSQGILISDAENRILRVNHAFTEITGYTIDDVLGLKPQQVLSSGRHDREFYETLWEELLGAGEWQGEIWDRRKSGEHFPASHHISLVKDDEHQITQYISIFDDITEKKRAEQNIQYLAHYDQLTNLPNRSLFNDRLEHSLARAKRRESLIALLFIDLDRFKYVNDTLGHDAGDLLLMTMASRMKETLREQDTLARLGGDEFTVILEDLAATEDAQLVAEKIIAELSTPLEINGHPVVIGGSIGISLFPDHGDSGEMLIKQADIAMYKAKEGGRNQYQYFDASLTDNTAGKFYLEGKMRRALENEEFSVVYQPQVNIANHRIIGAEALVRWNDPERGLVSPIEFIPLAEETGLVVPLGEWVLREACRGAKQWLDLGLHDIQVSVNVSARQLTDGELYATVKRALDDSGLPVELLELEITESAVMTHTEQAIAELVALGELGVSLALDDFGTGYSSLSYLKRLPVDRVKIDRAFIKDMHINQDDAAIVDTIIAMTKTLGLRVIAEGVELAEHIDYVKEGHCREVQGYFYSKPLPFEDFVQLARAFEETNADAQFEEESA